MKTSYKFTQAGGKRFIIYIFFNLLLLEVLKSYFDDGMAMLVGLGISITLFILLRKYFITVVEFKETYLQLNNGLNKKNVKVDYAEISKITFFYGRLMKLQVDTISKKIKLPPPAKLEMAEELFQWLATKNPAIKMDIIK